MFNNPIAVYSSYFILLFLRSFIIAVGNTFVRTRFPGYHFDILIGIFNTASTITIFINYPFFIWVQNQFLIAMSLVLSLLLLTFIHPLHLLIKKYMKSVVKERLSTTQEINTNQ
ncbi:hypothetical protein Avbf_16693 [Armadillidium vulgare]|nr:hypothetical protein Avbf_18440 [Armadillidium vulgare]RXG61993.1 hypothetical protein Avbf_16693 [Armadillidium vulgare]